MTTNASVGNHHDQLRMRAGLRQLGQAARASAAATATAAAAPPPPSPCGAPPTQGCGCCTGADMWDSPSCQQPVATPLQPSRHRAPQCRGNTLPVAAATGSTRVAYSAERQCWQGRGDRSLPPAGVARWPAARHAMSVCDGELWSLRLMCWRWRLCGASCAVATPESVESERELPPIHYSQHKSALGFSACDLRLCRLCSRNKSLCSCNRGNPMRLCPPSGPRRPLGEVEDTAERAGKGG